jgi:hypothetical protein
MKERTFVYNDERISVKNLGDGRHVVKVTPGGAKIIAYISDGKATRYEAENASGDRQALFGIFPDSADAHVTPDGFCEVCTFDEFAGAVICYTLLECPPPIDQKQGPHIV